LQHGEDDDERDHDFEADDQIDEPQAEVYAEARPTYVVRPARSLGGALLTLIIFSLLAGGGVIAFKWLQTDVARQRTDAPASTGTDPHR